MVSEQSRQAECEPQCIATLHGFAGTPKTFEGTNLPIGRALWLPGHGGRPDLSAQTFTDALNSLAEHLLKLQHPPHLLAYSMGARLALWVCLRFPERVHSATLIGPNPGLELPAAFEERQRWEQQWIRVLEEEGVGVFEERWAELPVFRSQKALPPSVLAQQRRARRSHSAQGLAHALRVCGLGVMPSCWSTLPSLRTPVQILVGEEDAKFIGLAERAQRICPAISLRVIGQAGHNLCLEAPRVVRASVLDFLTSTRPIRSHSLVVAPQKP